MDWDLVGEGVMWVSTFYTKYVVSRIFRDFRDFKGIYGTLSDFNGFLDGF